MSEHGYQIEHIKTTYPEIQANSLEETIVPALEWLIGQHRRPLMIDDSGLFVRALKGFPGVYSAHVFKTLGCEGILRLMEGVSDRSAQFECCIGFMKPGDKPHISRAVAKGTISTVKLGMGGFGFDPIFVPEGYAKTYAQLEISEKNRISHRGRAIGAFIRELPRLLHDR